MKKILMSAVVATLGLSVAGPALSADIEEIRRAAMAAAGQRIFHKCGACHAEDGQKAAFGPSLKGVIGRKAGTLEGFEYSAAMKASGHTWTEEMLRKWMADNKSVLPGTRMRHVHITDPAEQDYLLEFLKTIEK